MSGDAARSPGGSAGPRDGPATGGRRAVIERLRALPLLAGCGEAELAALAARLTPRTVAPGGVLMRQGERADRFALVTAGEARVTRSGGARREMGPVRAGSVLGELALLRGAPRAATVIATEPTEVLVGDAAAFSALLALPGLGARLRGIARRRLAANVRPVRLTLRDRTAVGIRPVLPADAHLVDSLATRVSRETHYRRFFTAGGLSEAAVTYLTEVDYLDHFAWVGVAEEGGGAEAVIAEARYVRLEPGSAEADVAFLVVDDRQRRGLGSLLFDALAVAARANGVRRFVAEVLADNAPMLAILARAGAVLDLPAGSVRHASMPVPRAAAGRLDAGAARALAATVREIRDGAGAALGMG